MDWPLPPGTTRLLLVRHGETDAAARGRCVGRLDVALSPVGRLEAEATARRLAALAPGLRPVALVTSPSRRALETAAPLAAALALPLDVDDGWQEVHFGALEGLTFDEAATLHPDAWRAWMDHPADVRFPDGESLADVRSRACWARARLLDRHPGAVVAAVSHAGPIRALLGEALGVTGAPLFSIPVPTGSLSVIDHGPGGAAVRAVGRSGP